jgi:hypothetical protein
LIRKFPGTHGKIENPKGEMERSLYFWNTLTAAVKLSGSVKFKVLQKP